MVAVPDVVSADLGSEAAMLNLRDGVYYGLNEVGRRVWQLVQEPRSVAEIRDVITAEYDVLPERGLADIRALLRQLLEAGLIEARDEATA